MEKDKSYSTLKRLLESGSIKNMEEIATIIGRTNLKTTIGIHYDTFRKRLKKPEDFAFKHVQKLAKLIDVDPRVISNLIFDILEKKK